MNVSEQGNNGTRDHYQAIPRTLVFVTSQNPANGATELLLLRGAPDKRLWANRYNGLGGHVEADEDVLAAARRELQEEAGLALDDFKLCGVINVDTGAGEDGRRPGVVVFVFHAHSKTRSITGSEEGTPEWIPLATLSEYPLVDDLHEVIPRTLFTEPVFFGHYTPQPDGILHYRFTS